MKAALRVLPITGLLVVVAVNAFAAGSGLISKPSPHSVPETMDRLVTVLQSKGMTIFARIDHAAEGRAQDAADPIADLRQSQGRNPPDGGGSHGRHRPAVQGVCLAGRRGEGSPRLQRAVVLEGTPRDRGEGRGVKG